MVWGLKSGCKVDKEIQNYNQVLLPIDIIKSYNSSKI